ncbi:hypothetical protein G7Y79_00001g003580 [Physcia stellaris]|nr:hypothetical protein G7Y79_00001g003580 [Physcia stellaris]
MPAYHSIFLNDQDVRIIGTSPRTSFPSYLSPRTSFPFYLSTTPRIPNPTNIPPLPPGNIALLPLRTRTRGPAYTLPPLPSGTSELDIDGNDESYDPLDEILSLFRANTFFAISRSRGRRIGC